MSITPRPTGPQPGDRPLPVKHRIAKHGVLIFELTKEQRAKLVLGYNVQISVSQFFQHNPGHVEVSARLDVTTQTGFKPEDRIEVLDQVPTIVSEKKEGGGS